MKIQRVREIAREQGLDPGKAEKAELIKAIRALKASKDGIEVEGKDGEE